MCEHIEQGAEEQGTDEVSNTSSFNIPCSLFDILK